MNAKENDNMNAKENDNMNAKEDNNLNVNAVIGLGGKYDSIFYHRPLPKYRYHNIIDPLDLIYCAPITDTTLYKLSDIDAIDPYLTDDWNKEGRQEFALKCYKLDENIRSLMIQAHYYNAITKEHFYAISSTKYIVCGFYISKDISTMCYAKERRKEWEPYKCKEEILFPKNMAEIMQEWDPTFVFDDDGYDNWSY